MTPSIEVFQLHRDGEPVKPNRSVSELAKHLGVSFAASNLQLSMIALGRRIEELEFQLQLLRFEVRTRRWWHVLTRRDR